MKKLFTILLSVALFGAFSMPQNAHAHFWDRFKRHKQSQSQMDHSRTRTSDEQTTSTQEGGYSTSPSYGTRGGTSSSPSYPDSGSSGSSGSSRY